MSPRAKRETSKTGLYYVMLSGNREDIFLSKKDKQCILVLAFDKALADGYEVYGYCILNNSAHFIIKTNEVALSASIKKITTSYASYYNRKYALSGHVFNDRFKSFPIEDEDTLLETLQYIHSLPSLTWGDCDNAAYPFSSLGYYTKRCDYMEQTKHYSPNRYEHIIQKANQEIESFQKLFASLCSIAPLCFDEDMLCRALIKEYEQTHHVKLSEINEKTNQKHRDNLITILHESASFSIRKISGALGVNRGTVHNIVIKHNEEEENHDL